jgi:hypothetical protein
MLRCPTCVGILPGPDVPHCPHCGQRFRGKKRPIELGYENRITTRMSAVEHAYLEARAHNVHAPATAPTPEPEPSTDAPSRWWRGRNRPEDSPAAEGIDLDLTVADADEEPIDVAAAERAERTTDPERATPPEVINGRAHAPDASAVPDRATGS